MMWFTSGVRIWGPKVNIISSSSNIKASCGLFSDISKTSSIYFEGFGGKAVIAVLVLTISSLHIDGVI